MSSSKPSRSSDLLRQERIRRNWRQQDIADQLGITVVTVNRWERGNQQPSAYFRSRLSALFGKSAEELGLLPESTQLPDEQGSETTASVENYTTTLPTTSHLWNIPYLRNPFFTGRDAELHHMHEVLNRQKTTTLSQSIAISGLGGIGKTQTAIEYAYRHVQDYTAVFWINAETYETIASSMVAIASLLDLPEKQEQKQEKIITAVIHWLMQHSDWLLVLDNVENPTLVQCVLPAARYGSLLFTSRRQALGFIIQTLNLEPMTPEVGIRFMLHRAKLLEPTTSLDQLAPKDMFAAQEIATAMDGLPLALDQVGTYIEATQCSLSDYLSLFQSSQQRLLDERNAYMDHPLSVTRTFTLTFELLKQNNVSAADLLTVCAFLAPEAVPESLFLEGSAHLGSAFETLAADPFKFNDTIKTLLSYSLLRRNTTDKTLTIHRLVQTVLKGHLPEEIQRTWAVRIIHTVSKLFPSRQDLHSNYWHICNQLLPQAIVCISLHDQWGENIHDCVSLMSHVASYLISQARYNEAEALLQQARVHIPDLEHSIVIEMLLVLADLYHRQGKYAESENVLQQALSKVDLLDPEHPLVAEVLGDLAGLYMEMRKYPEAETLLQRALHIEAHALGSEHPVVGKRLSVLAMIYSIQGKYEQARILHQRVLYIWQQAWGPENPRIAIPLNNLADSYLAQGKYELAEPLCQQALHIWEQALGPEHPNIAFALLNLAELYTEQAQYEKAESLYLRAFRIREQVMGPKHRDLANPLEGLANLYKKQGKYEQAEPLYQRALDIREQVPGVEELEIAIPLTGLATLLSEQGKYEEAEPLYQRALALRQKYLVPQHPDIAEILQYLAHFYQAQYQITEALSFYQQALAIREQSLGSEHPKTIKTRNDLAHLLNESKQANDLSIY